MSKRRNVAFSKPDEPSFLKRIKQQIGYKEGPTVDTKRENLGDCKEEDLQDTNEEKPTVVVLQPGDLTAEEADKHTRESEEAPADLTQKIKFKKPEKSGGISETKEKKRSSSSGNNKEEKKNKIKKQSLLSFNQDDEEEEEYKSN